MKHIIASIALLFATSAFASGYIGDYAPGDTVDCNFGTVNPSTGASFTLAGTPAISVYKDNGTTESTTGVTLTADFDARTGLNHLRVTTASDGTFYSAGSYFEAVITAGTVNSVSVVGQPVCAFTLNKAKVSGVTGSVASIASGGISESSFATTTGSFDALGWTRQGTAQGATSTTVTLDASAPFGDNTNVGGTLWVKGSTAGTYWQPCLISGYVASTKVATVSCASGFVTPTGTITYKLAGTAPSSGGSGLDASGVRSAIGLASANLDTQLSTISGYIDTEVAAIKTKTDFLPSATAGSAGGVFIAGTNAATTITTGLTANITGNVSGSVGSVTGNVSGTVNGLTTTAQGNVRTAVGLASANLDTQLSGLATSSALSTLSTTIGAAGAGLTAIPWNTAWNASVQADALAALNSLSITEPAAKPSWGSSTLAQWIAWIGAWSRNEINQTSTAKTLRNDADNADIVTCAVSDDGTTFSVQECSP